ncbi:PocR ligand-binding domain-containing protein [Peptacetobacter hiranonis]|uniref:PocR ligand-binding domain-containing protein n=1 Tax=Peptacetobacter hiranonis TaxID=89152 RepID=UPI002E7830F6|nr:PocR ligand-binding domain-containing protein [Peptacetobacter hiranonis]MEE0248090.1 PocR ligand-binding domain-containing protein [Peptacetobacter hiranonis]
MTTNSKSINISINEKYLEGKEDNFDIISIFGRKNLDEIQKIISDVTGLAFVTVDYRGEPVSEPTKFSNFCRKMRTDKNKRTLCKLSDASGSIIAATTKQTSIYFCPCGLLEVAIPIIINDKYLGGFIGGQVRCLDAPDSVMRLSKNMIPGGANIPDTEIRAEKTKDVDISDLKIYSYKEIVSIAKLVELIINQLTKQELISGHNQKKNLTRISELEDKIKRLEYQNNSLKEKVDTLKRDNNLFFMRNTFNMISNLAVIEDASKTNGAVLRYLDFIESGLDIDGNKTIRDEIRKVEKFIKLNKIRYSDRLDYNIKFEKDVLDINIPYSLILPFVYAGIYYTLNTEDIDLMINISISKVGKDIEILIEDNGTGQAITELENVYKIYGGNHEGNEIVKSIVDVQKFMTDTFGTEYRINTERIKGKGTKVYIKYPINFDEGFDYV